MTMEHEQWKKILSAIDNEADLSKDNVIEKVKKKLKAESEDEYKKWDKASFNVNYLFHTVFQSTYESECTLLHLVAYDNLGNVADALSKAEGINVNAVIGASLWTPLHFAVRYASSDIVKILIENGADVNANKEDGWAPLHLAAKNGYRETTDILMAKGADPLLKNNDGKTPMDLDKNGYIKQFLEKKAIKNGIIAGSSVALLGAAIAVTLLQPGQLQLS